MNTRQLRRARRLFVNDLAPPSVQRHNIRTWVRAVRRLGDKWIALPADLGHHAVHLTLATASAALVVMHIAGWLPGGGA